MTLHSYVMSRDYGFAPNPFHGWCTLCTCKPDVRHKAQAGDWVAGIGALENYDQTGYLIYAMCVEETMTFDAYWGDPRFGCKRPVLNGSLVQVYGDNIYHRVEGQWVQENSHHSLEDGKLNEPNLKTDTRTDRVLLARCFVYFGGDAVLLPEQFCPEGAQAICRAGRNPLTVTGPPAEAFVAWLESEARWGIQGWPAKHERHRKIGG